MIYRYNNLTSLTTPEGALGVLAAMGGRTRAAAAIAFAALDTPDPLTRATIYEKVNSQYGEASKGGDGQRFSVNWFLDHGFINYIGSQDARPAYLQTSPALEQFAQGHNALSLILVRRCLVAERRRRATPDNDQLLNLAYTSFADAWEQKYQPTNDAKYRRHQVTALARAARIHPESVTYRALEGWAALRGIAASVKTAHDNELKLFRRAKLRLVS